MGVRPLAGPRSGITYEAPSPQPQPLDLRTCRACCGSRCGRPNSHALQKKNLRAPKRLDPHQQENGSERSGFKGRRGCVPCGDHGEVGLGLGPILQHVYGFGPLDADVDRMCKTALSPTSQSVNQSRQYENIIPLPIANKILGVGSALESLHPPNSLNPESPKFVPPPPVCKPEGSIENRGVFFNDLPCLTPGAPKEIGWRAARMMHSRPLGLEDVLTEGFRSLPLV